MADMIWFKTHRHFLLSSRQITPQESNHQSFHNEKTINVHLVLFMQQRLGLVNKEQNEFRGRLIIKKKNNWANIQLGQTNF